MPTASNIPELGHALVCITCGTKFIFTAGEQDYYKRRGLAEPRRCKKCRELRKRTDGVFGARVVLVDSVTDLVLCNRCRNPASKTVSLTRNEPVCVGCSQPEGGITSVEDYLGYEDWKSRKGANPYVS